MPRVDPELIERLGKKLGLKRAAVYKRIDQKVRQTHLDRHVAAVALAGDVGINISRYKVERAAIRSSGQNTTVPNVALPELGPSRPARATKGGGVRARVVRPRRGNSVWVVHGRNDKARRELSVFLRALGLQPLEWNQAVKATGRGAPYVGEVLEKAFEKAVAVVVLLTPDDEARLRRPFWGSNEPPHEKNLTPQARSNVLFEAGMALGRNPRSTVLVQLGDVRPFSNVAGRHVVHLNNSAAKRQELATKLANAGCNVVTSGQDWLEAGDLTL